MEGERKQNLLAQQPLKPGLEFGLGEREGVSQVQPAVHVGVREGAEELAVLRLELPHRHAAELAGEVGRGGLVDLVLLPELVNARFNGGEVVSALERGACSG